MSRHAHLAPSIFTPGVFNAKAFDGKAFDGKAFHPRLSDHITESIGVFHRGVAD
jgi:hypothetical protein